MSSQQVILAPSWGRPLQPPDFVQRISRSLGHILPQGRRLPSPGVANEALARRISRLVGDRRGEFLIFAEREVADALYAERIAANHVVRQPAFSHYITTKHVFAEMCVMLRVHGFYRDFRYFLVTHPLHADRCREILIAQGIPKKQLFCLECEEVYDSRDMYPWLRTRSSSLVYESAYRFCSRFLPV